MSTCYRRQFLQLAGVGGAVFVSGLGAMAHAANATTGPGYDDFFFVQLSDAHWGFEGRSNPVARGTLSFRCQWRARRRHNAPGSPCDPSPECINRVPAVPG